MIAAILSKLRLALTESISSERQVVYILVAIRKLLELSNDSERFVALRFYCDWATHAVMDREGSARIVRRFNAWQKISDDLRDAGVHAVLDPQLQAELDEITELRRFRKQLATLLAEHQVDLSLAADDAKWRAFVEFFAQVVHGCPLKCADSRLPYVDEVIIKFLDLRGINRDELSIAVQWSWVNKKTGHESRTHALF
jgi:hypothetical protein